jgi:DNA-binding NarL/FixJ family response regulator
MENQVKLMIVDDHTVVREGLKRLLETNPSFRVIGEEGTVAAALDRVRRLRPDVIIIDIKLPDGTGLDAAREILGEATPPKVLILSTYDDFPIIEKAISLGVSAYLPKSASFGEITAAILAVYHGEQYLHRAITARLMEGLRQKSQAATVTPGEKQMLLFLSEGLSYTEIGRKLFASERTVRRHAERLYEKIGVTERTQAVAEALRRGWLE